MRKYFDPVATLTFTLKQICIAMKPVLNTKVWKAENTREKDGERKNNNCENKANDNKRAVWRGIAERKRNDVVGR